MVRSTPNTNDESRRTFLKALGVGGAATGGLLTMSDGAAAKGTTSNTQATQNQIDAEIIRIKPDSIIPANQYHTMSLVGKTTKSINRAAVLVNGQPLQNVEMKKPNTIITKPFEMVTAADLSEGEPARYTIVAENTDGNLLAGTEKTSVVESLGVSQGTQNGLTDTVEPTSLLSGLTGQSSSTTGASGLLSNVGTLGESGLLSMLQQSEQVDSVKTPKQTKNASMY